MIEFYQYKIDENFTAAVHQMESGNVLAYLMHMRELFNYERMLKIAAIK